MNVLIIDNQFNQYKALRDCLIEKKGYSIVPSRSDNDPMTVYKDYVALLSSVKVYIYKPEKQEDFSPDEKEKMLEKAYREKAWNSIMSYVQECDLIIMDYRLGSPVTCLTGLDIALEIWKEKNIPILILSRDEQSREDIKLEWTEVNKKNYNRIAWEVKGYWGSQLLPEDFVDPVITSAIDKLFARWKVVQPVEEKDKLKLAIALAYFQSYDMHLKRYKGYYDRLMEMLRDGYNCPKNNTFNYLYNYFVEQESKTITDEIYEYIKKYVEDYLREQPH